MLIRKPHVAGSFYPSDPRELRQFCETYLRPHSVQPPKEAKAVILPHAGYIYSGKTACKVLSKVQVPSQVLLMGPNHWGVGQDFSVYAQGRWQTPLGDVPVAEDLSQALTKASPELRIDEKAHAEEHSLEVLLPFLQIKNSRVEVAPLIVGGTDLTQAAEAARKIGDVIASSHEKILVAVSNDMSHYEADEVTRAKDRYALDAILALDADALIRAVQRHRITMCGLMPVYMLLQMKDRLKIRKAELVEYTTSAEASGDFSRVVGYAGFIFE